MTHDPTFWIIARSSGLVAYALLTLGADELVITSVAHRHADRLRSHELIAKRWGI